MPEVEMVDGEDISHEDANAPGWKTALSKNKRSPRQQEAISSQSVATAGRRTATAQDVVRRLAAASRLPRLPRSHIRVIVRPKGGLDLKKVSLIRLAQALATAAELSPEETKEDIVCPNITQNILVVSTPESKNAGAYAALCLIRLGSTEYQVSAYMAASDDTCKGVIRGVDVDIDEQQLAAMIINQRNPKAMEVHRIKETTTVVILFSGLKAPITWADRAKPKQAQQPAQVTHAALPEQKEDPRIAFLLQENASLKAQLQKMRVEFEALKNSAQAPARPLSVEPRPAKRRIGAEGEVAAASDSDVLGAIRDLQKSVARQAECFDLVACKVAMIESRLGLGENSFVPVTPVSLVSPAGPSMPMAQAPRK
ncbi:hypothetical protein MTO96_036590 [Rhipicephalus appendiculatus]